METLKQMISNTSHDLYYAAMYILYQVSRENKEIAPFTIDRAYFGRALKERISKDKESLFQAKTLEGLNLSDGEAILIVAEKLKKFGMNVI